MKSLFAENEKGPNAPKEKFSDKTFVRRRCARKLIRDKIAMKMCVCVQDCPPPASGKRLVWWGVERKGDLHYHLHEIRPMKARGVRAKAK
ncbi:hypothetical protein Peur_007961 [Populus x canadensis]